MLGLGRFGVFATAFVSAAPTMLGADPMAVQVLCSNGKPISELVISVFDNADRPVEITSPTNNTGYFTILDTSEYLEPFFMIFQTSKGTCGKYFVQPISDSEGRVELNYYPTNVPCSCANLTDHRGFEKE